MRDPARSVPVEILLVEDNSADVRLAEEGFREAKLAGNLTTVRNGNDALDRLLRRGEHADAPRPDIVLLDLKLPGIDGHEVLRRVKSEPSLRAIPVIVLSSSEAEADVVKSYEFGANCHIPKPRTFEGIISVLSAIVLFWFSTARLPCNDDPARPGRA